MSIEQSTIWGCYGRAARMEAQTSPTSAVDILDVIDGASKIHLGLDDRGMEDLLESSKVKVAFRLIFLDTAPLHSERLQITSVLLERLFKRYNVSPRFAASLSRQHSPARSTQYDKSGCAIHQEFWYTAVLRSMQSNDVDGHNDLCQRALSWKRLCVWAGYDLTNKIACVMFLRCPVDLKQRIFSEFQFQQAVLLTRHPMLIHAVIVENVIIKTYDFLESFSEPVYSWEPQNTIASDIQAYTHRSQAFLQLARQITQTDGDYDILTATVKHLQKEQAWIRKHLAPPANHEEASMWLQNHEFAEGIFDYFLEEVQLVRSYSKLYEKRTEIGISEGFHMVNQRDAEINLKTAMESTQIAKDTRQDSQSLRRIQILGMVFLPVSLCSSILGMGFFSTQPDDSGHVRFLASGRWWIFLVLAVPLTILTLGSMGVMSPMSQRWRGRTLDTVEDRRFQSDEEKTVFGGAESSLNGSRNVSRYFKSGRRTEQSKS